MPGTQLLTYLRSTSSKESDKSGVALSLQNLNAFVRSFVTKSELLSNKHTSLKFVHFKVPLCVIHVASLGELQFNFGKASPPKKEF